MNFMRSYLSKTYSFIEAGHKTSITFFLAQYQS